MTSAYRAGVIFVCACNTARAPSFCTRDTSDARHPAREVSRTASIRALRYVPRGGSALSRSAISGIHRNIRARVSSDLRKKSRCRNSYRFDTSSLTPRCASFCAPSRFAWRHLLPRMIASNSFSVFRLEQARVSLAFSHEPRASVTALGMVFLVVMDAIHASVLV